MNLLFLYNELINPVKQREMRLPLRFVSFAYVKAKMYRHFRNQSVFAVKDVNQSWGNRCVYGALFLLSDFDYFIRIIDAYHVNSLSALALNHNRDIHHRISVEATPIQFDTLSNLGRLLYTEGESVECFTYFGNHHHNKIRQRLNINDLHYRIIDGVDKGNFSCLHKEVLAKSEE